MTVVVVGAGVVGMSCAAWLQRAGEQVTVIDRGEPGSGCSYGNACAISVGSVVPMAMPGMWKSVPKWLLDPLGPLAVRWSYLPRAAPWLFKWLLASRAAAARRASDALTPLHERAVELYRELLDGQADELIRRSGHLYVWKSEAPYGGDLFAHALRQSHGVRVEDIRAEELRQLEPALAPGFKRGMLLPDNGHTVNPERLVQTLAERVRRGGGTIRQADVTGFELGPDGPRAVRTDQGDLPVATLVVAAGAHSVRVAGALGADDVPLEAERGYHMTLPDPGISLMRPVVNASAKFFCTPMEQGLRLAGTVEIAGLDAPPNWRRAEVLVRQARDMFPALNDAGGKPWMGFRPSTPDSLPVIDRSPRFANVWFAFGHGHTGMTGGPMTGRLIADLVTGRSPTIDPAPYRIARWVA